ncbi:hypothetical protein CUMW_075180 [Citrus unshiu]|nr:hypothetical protein CUMW_075180 [Citrus unshiu]
MALSSSMALRRAGAYRLLFSKLIRPASVSRSFNTNAQVVDVERRPDRSVSRRRDPSPSFFPVQQNTQIIKGEGPQNESESGGGDDDQENGRRYSTRIDLPSNLYKFDDIKAGMKNGVLKIVVPKVKEDEAKNVFKVNVE